MPVRKLARLGEQVGAAANACRNSTPCAASRCRFGVGTACPYGCTKRPVLCECRKTMLVRFMAFVVTGSTVPRCRNQAMLAS